MRIEQTKVWVAPTKDPIQFLMGCLVNAALAKAANLSCSGMAYSLVAKDELMALIEVGFKPFAKATLEVELFEKEFDYSDSRVLMFDLQNAEFNGGIGAWTALLEPRGPKKHKRPCVPAF